MRTQLQQAGKKIARLNEENNRLKNELQAANEKYQKQAAKYKQNYKDATAKASDIQCKLDRKLAKASKIIRQLKRDSARYKRQIMLAIWRCSAHNKPSAKVSDLNSVHNFNSDDGFGHDLPPTGPFRMTGRRPSDRMPAPCDLEAENAQVKNYIEKLRLRIDVLEVRSCEKWYCRVDDFSR